MTTIEKYSKIISRDEEMAVGVRYFDDLYRADVLVGLENQTFYINEMLNYPNTNYSSYDESTNKAVEV